MHFARLSSLGLHIVRESALLALSNYCLTFLSKLKDWEYLFTSLWGVGWRCHFSPA